MNGALRNDFISFQEDLLELRISAEFSESWFKRENEDWESPFLEFGDSDLSNYTVDNDFYSRGSSIYYKDSIILVVKSYNFVNFPNFPNYPKFPNFLTFPNFLILLIFLIF